MIHENKGGNMTGVEWTNLIRRTENVFFHLIEKAKKEMTEEELKNILQMTTSSGTALIRTASDYSSKIFDYLVDILKDLVRFYFIKRNLKLCLERKSKKNIQK